MYEPFKMPFGNQRNLFRMLHQAFHASRQALRTVQQALCEYRQPVLNGSPSLSGISASFTERFYKPCGDSKQSFRMLRQRLSARTRPLRIVMPGPGALRYPGQRHHLHQHRLVRLVPAYRDALRKGGFSRPMHPGPSTRRRRASYWLRH